MSSEISTEVVEGGPAENANELSAIYLCRMLKDPFSYCAVFESFDEGF